MKRGSLAAFLLLTAAAGATAQQLTITGRLLDNHYRPAADVPIMLIAGPVDAKTMAAAIAAPLARSGPDGGFRVEVRTDVAGINHLMVGGGRHALQRRQLLAATGQLELGTISLSQGFTMAGRVVAADGTALAGAEVEAFDKTTALEFRRHHRLEYPWRLGGMASTDARGRFRVPGAAASTGEVQVRCAGQLDANVSAAGAGQPIEVVMQAARVLRGRVLDEKGDPLSGIPVRAGLAETTSGSDGAFVLPLRNEPRSISAAPPAASGRDAVSAKVPAEDEAIELHLGAAKPERTATRIVRAVDARGAAVEQFEVVLDWVSADALQGWPLQLLLGRAAGSAQHRSTATSGRAWLPPALALQDVGVVFVRAPGHGWASQQIRRPQRSQPLDDIVVTLPAGRAVDGRVIDRDGEPIAGVTVAPTEPLSAAQQALLTSDPVLTRLMARSPDCVVTAADGSFRLDGLPPAMLQLMVLAPGGGMLGQPQALDLRGEQAAAEPLTLRTPRPVTLRGQLREPPPPGTRVRLAPRQIGKDPLGIWRLLLGEQSAPVTDDGSFVFANVAPGPWSPELIFPASPRDGLPPVQPFSAWHDAAAADAVAEVDAAVVTIHGAIDGDIPWYRLAVAVMPADTAFAEPQRFAPLGPTGLVDPDRSFRVIALRKPSRLVLIDTATGIAIDHRDLDAEALSEPVGWRGDATALQLRLRRRGPEPASDGEVRVTYQPTLEHWPARRKNDKLQFSPEYSYDDRLGSDRTLWLPAKAGTLIVRRDKIEASLDVSVLRAGAPTVVVTFDDETLVAAVDEQDG